MGIIKNQIIAASKANTTIRAIILPLRLFLFIAFLRVLLIQMLLTILYACGKHLSKVVIYFCAAGDKSGDYAANFILRADTIDTPTPLKTTLEDSVSF